FRQRDRSDLHVPQRKLFARDATREVVHQFFLARRIAVNNSRFLPLKRFAFKHLRNSSPQKFNSGLHVLLESIRPPPRQSQQTRTILIFEIIYIAAIGRLRRFRPQLFEDTRDRTSSTCSGQPAHKHVVPRRGNFDSHFQRAQSAVLSDHSFERLSLGGSFIWHTGGIATPAQLFRRKLGVCSSRLVFHDESFRAGYSSTSAREKFMCGIAQSSSSKGII